MKRILLALLLCAASVRAGDIFIFNSGASTAALTNGAALGETAWQNPAAATNWTWTSNGREITLTGYSGPNAVVIPDMLDGLPVTGFGEVFRGNTDITSVGGGANIKEVGGSAFGACFALNSVSLPACTTVGNDAFTGCEALTSVSLPACTTVGNSAFDECTDLTSVSLPACTTVGGSAFGACFALTSVSLPACTTVGNDAFTGCEALNSVIFGQNAPAPAANVFVNSTPTIYISNPHATGWGDTWNGRPVVRAASMVDIASHNTNPASHADIRALISTAGGTTNYVGTLIETAWQNPAAATNWTWTSSGREITLTNYSGPNAVVIPDMLDGLPVTGFGGIFTGNTDITSVGGGANIKAVGTDAFNTCEALTSVSLPACTTVGNYAFSGCDGLNSVSLPACTTVGNYAFYGCGNLNSVSLPACTTVGADAFAGCDTLNSVSLPACTTVGGAAFSGCDTLNSVSLPACTTVGDHAFAGCDTLKSVSLPACTTVGHYAFENCGNLNSVSFGQNAPAPAANVFINSTPTIYVSNPHATGWGDTWNGRPVVRAASMADIASHNTNPASHADIRALVGGASGSIVKPIIPASATVAVTSTQAVYRVDTSTAITLTNDLSDLALTGTQEAAWSVALNLTDWPATSTVFAADIEWDQEPELTVTGCYRFAFSSSGGTVQGRQTFPKVYAWDFNSTWEGTAARASGAMVGTFDAITDIMVFQMPNIPLLIKPLYSLYTGRPVPENGMQIKIGLSRADDEKPTYTVSPIIVTNRLVMGYGNQMFLSAIPKNEAEIPSGVGALPSSMYLTFYAGTTNATWTPGPMLHGFGWRQQNTLEVKAYEAGWRP